MNGRGGDAPPPNGGEFLLQLLRRPSNSTAAFIPPPQQPAPQNFSQDPAVAAVGPSIPTFPLFPSSSDGVFSFPSLSHLPSPLLAPQNYFQQNPNLNPNLNPSFSSPIPAYYNPPRFDSQSKSTGGDSAASSGHDLMFGSLNRDVLNNGSRILDQNRKNENNFPSSSFMVKENFRGNHTAFRENNSPPTSFEVKETARGNPTAFRVYRQEEGGNGNDRMKQGSSGSHRAVAAPPGFLSNSKNVRHMDHEYERKTSYNGNKGKGGSGHMLNNNRSSNQLDLPADGSVHSASTFGVVESMKNLHVDHMNDVSKTDDLEDQLLDSLAIEDESGEKSDKKKHHHDKDYRSDKRGQWIMGQRMRILKRQTSCRNDVNMFNAPLLALFYSLNPSEEEKVKQKQLMTLLEKLVRKEWPDAHLYLYGSCANSFGFSKSDIDVCLQMDLGGVEKSEVLLKLANIFETDNLQNVQALTRARVPIVKLMDPVTGISCDICVNNVLAVENTKLLRDYALIDVRLRQLAFIVKHWAKSRGVNATYQGTLSSYAYVLMCIHFLQQRRPPILPCLQRMRSTYVATVDGIQCAYFDQVEKLQNGRAQNGESIAQLVWGFFHYWAYSHDYANDVISVRTGSTLSKRGKEWTRRVGNDRHLICIEDPFEISHDLGRVVDKYSIRVLREEFERAAEILQYDPNPCVTLFEPYIPN